MITGKRDRWCNCSGTSNWCIWLSYPSHPASCFEAVWREEGCGCSMCGWGNGNRHLCRACLKTIAKTRGHDLYNSVLPLLLFLTIIIKIIIKLI